MKAVKIKTSRILALAVYLYLAVPVIIFLYGWCRWYIAVPVSIFVLIGLIMAVKEHRMDRPDIISLDGNDMAKIMIILLIIILWVIMSGIGGYVWQNDDHSTRNTLFTTLETEKWPVIDIVETDGMKQKILLSYYLGFWLPSALIGKVFGLEAGRIALIIWAILGVTLFYALVCAWQRKIAVWPLAVFIFFSGLDAVGISLSQNSIVRVFADNHLEWWFIDFNFQFSSMTTQLFWTFNQAIPAWIASIYVFLYEKPRNMIFLFSLLLITASFPMAGLIPFGIFFMLKRGRWEKNYKTVFEIIKSAGKNWMSWQNVVASGSIIIIAMAYICANQAVRVTIQSLSQLNPIKVLAIIFTIIIGIYVIMRLVLMGKGRLIAACGIAGGIILFCRLLIVFPFEEWQSTAFGWVDLTIFYILEVGLFFACIHQSVHCKGLLWVNAITLYVIPLIRVGYNADFCMRASIPGLVLLSLWCIDTLRQKKNMAAVYALLFLLAVGAVTPIHEIKRIYSYTKYSYENPSISRDSLLLSSNYRGDADSFFAEYIAKE